MNIGLRKRKTVFNLPTPTLLFSHIKEPFRWCCQYGTFLQKIISMTKIGRFLRGFSVVDFSAVGFLNLLKTLTTQRQKSLFLYKSEVIL